MDVSILKWVTETFGVFIAFLIFMTYTLQKDRRYIQIIDKYQESAEKISEALTLIVNDLKHQAEDHNEMKKKIDKISQTVTGCPNNRNNQ